jgi:ADP-ribose pyrophosphatase
MTDPNIHIVEVQVAYRGFFKLIRYRLQHRLYDGGWSAVLTRELLERGHAAAVLPYDPVRDEVVLVEQFRIGALRAPEGAWVLETIAGIVEPGEDPRDVARREAAEEAGCVVGELVPMYEFLVSPGGTSERIVLFCARVDASAVGGIHGLTEEGEDIRPRVWGWKEVARELEAGRISSATPIIALQWLALNRDRLRMQWGAASAAGR